MHKTSTQVPWTCPSTRHLDPRPRNRMGDYILMEEAWDYATHETVTAVAMVLHVLGTAVLTSHYLGLDVGEDLAVVFIALVGALFWGPLLEKQLNDDNGGSL